MVTETRRRSRASKRLPVKSPVKELTHRGPDLYRILPVFYRVGVEMRKWLSCVVVGSLDADNHVVEMW